MHLKQILFFCITLTPVPLLLFAVLLGGYWVPGALIYMTLFAVFCDEAFELNFADSGDSWAAKVALPVCLGIAHFSLLALAIYALSGSEYGILSKIILFFAFGLFLGTISHSNAHELIHRSNRLHRRLGKWIFISMLFGHHTSAHMLVHHIYVGTPKDPNTARYNESFYTFLKRASLAEFFEGLQAENNRLKKQDLRAISFRNPYWQYCLGAFMALILVHSFFGFTGLFSFIALCAYAQLQMLMTDFVQHYGLLRKQLDNGKYEPVSACHSWNAPHWFTAFLTLNASHHSDHHSSPTKPYTELEGHRHTAPQLPHSIPFMAVVALWPSKWREIMNPRLKAWRDV